MRDVVVFLSTPRSATQWIINTLNACYSDLMVAEHEPLMHQYQPDRYYRRPEHLDEYSRVPRIQEHFDRINNIRQRKIYVEVGWHNYGAILLFIRHFGSTVKVVHHVRHPVTNAASMVGVRWYQQGLRADGQASLPSPSMPGTIHTSFADHWDSMSSYGKSLFFWAEINAHGLELKQQLPDDRFFRSRMEDVFQKNGDTLRSLIAFLSLPYRAEVDDALGNLVDRWPRKAVVDFDWREVTRYPEVVDLANRLGYDVNDVDEARLKKRFTPAHSYLIYPLYGYLMNRPKLIEIARQTRREIWHQYVRFRSLLQVR